MCDVCLWNMYVCLCVCTCDTAPLPLAVQEDGSLLKTLSNLLSGRDNQEGVHAGIVLVSIRCAIWSLSLIAALFLGPLLQRVLLGAHSSALSVEYNGRGLAAMRTLLVAPLAEEFVFRATFIALLARADMTRAVRIFVSPAIFALAHVSSVVHVRREQGAGMPPVPWRIAWAITGVQVSYTYVFGVIAAYMYVATLTLSAPFAAHAACNAIGLPRFHDVPSGRLGTFIWSAYVAGIALFVAGVVSSDMQPTAGVFAA